MHLWNTIEPPSQNGERALIHIKGLPTLKLRADGRLPQDRLPQSIDITLDAGQLKAGMAYELDKEWPEPLCASAGVDPGKANTLTVRDSNGHTYHYKRPDETHFDKKKKKLQQRMQRQRDATIKDGRARWTSRRNREVQSGGCLQHRSLVEFPQSPAVHILHSQTQARSTTNIMTTSLLAADNEAPWVLVSDGDILGADRLVLVNGTRNSRTTR